jgi:serine/threonine protein kinase
MSGFVYRVKVDGRVLIKKEIPGPETVDEFLYEVNALNRLRHSQNVIRFHGVIVDDEEEYVKGLLISYAEQGALIDVIYDQEHPMSWPTREKWAKQIISGLSEIHEAGFVQGDLTLSNIVIDEHDDAKIIDINRRGCPVGWEPPEATPLIENSQRISMYIGVKSDLYQLGMVLWAVAMKDDEPEAQGRPLYIGSNSLDVPDWYRQVVDICLSEDPRNRLQALNLLSFFPEREEMDALFNHPSISVDDGETRKEYFVDSSANGYPQVRTVHPSSDWSYVGWSPSHLHSPQEGPDFYPGRGRSPPSPLPSNLGEYEPSRHDHSSEVKSSRYEDTNTATFDSSDTVPEHLPDSRRSATPRVSEESGTGLEENIKSDIGKPSEVTGQTEANLTREEGPNSMDPLSKNEHSTGTSPPRERRQGATENDHVQSTECFHELQSAQHNRDHSADSLESGATGPELEDNSNREHPYDPLDASTARDIEQAILNGRQCSTYNGRQSACLETVEREPASVPLPPSGPASESTEEATCISQGGMQDDECPKATVPMADIIPWVPSSTARHSGSSSTLQELPDDLKGVGSTYDLMSEKRLLSINDDDLTMLLTTDIT